MPAPISSRDSRQCTLKTHAAGHNRLAARLADVAALLSTTGPFATMTTKRSMGCGFSLNPALKGDRAMKQQPRSLLHTLAGLAGIAGPLAFTVAWMSAALVLAGYSSRAEDISDLATPTSGQPAIAIMVTGFVALGLGILVLTGGLWREFDRAGYRKFVPLLLAVIGAAVLLAGGFRSDCSEVKEASPAADCRRRCLNRSRCSQRPDHGHLHAGRHHASAPGLGVA